MTPAASSHSLPGRTSSWIRDLDTCVCRRTFTIPRMRSTWSSTRLLVQVPCGHDVHVRDLAALDQDWYVFDGNESRVHIFAVILIPFTTRLASFRKNDR